jgi:DNA polymerase/3'-5' exonuclease PolX
MTNREIAAILFNISSILDTQHGNPYRIRAYRRAARNLLRIRHSVAERVAAGQPLGLPRLGKSLTEKISALATKDALPFYEELCDSLPREERTLLKLNVPGLGPTIAARIHRDLGQTDASSLRHAVATGKLQKVWGIGPKRTAAILDAIGGSDVRQERFEI